MKTLKRVAWYLGLLAVMSLSLGAGFSLTLAAYDYGWLPLSHLRFAG